MGHASAIEMFGPDIEEEVMGAKAGPLKGPIDWPNPGIEAFMEHRVVACWDVWVLCHLFNWPSSGRNTFSVLCEEVNAMRQVSVRLNVETRGSGLYEVTRSIESEIDKSGIVEGLVTVFIKHTSASLTIQENADSAVQRDLLTFFEKIAPELDGYEHSAEGPDDMPAHIKAALTQVSLSIPVSERQMVLGTWQGIYLFEHRRRQHERCLWLHVVGE